MYTEYYKGFLIKEDYKPYRYTLYKEKEKNIEWCSSSADINVLKKTVDDIVLSDGYVSYYYKMKELFALILYYNDEHIEIKSGKEYRIGQKNKTYTRKYTIDTLPEKFKVIVNERMK